MLRLIRVHLGKGMLRCTKLQMVILKSTLVYLGIPSYAWINQAVPKHTRVQLGTPMYSLKHQGTPKYNLVHKKSVYFSGLLLHRLDMCFFFFFSQFRLGFISSRFFLVALFPKHALSTYRQNILFDSVVW